MDVHSIFLLADQKFTIRNSFYKMLLSLPMFLKYFLIFTKFQPPVSYIKTCIHVQMRGACSYLGRTNSTAACTLREWQRETE